MLVTENMITRCLEEYHKVTDYWAPEMFSDDEMISDLIDRLLCIASDMHGEAVALNEVLGWPTDTVDRPMVHGDMITLTDEHRAGLEDTVARGLVTNPEFYTQFMANPFYIYLGEVTQMPGHIFCAGRDGKVYTGFHPEDFRLLTDDET
jgi:hypothetical protein